MLQIFLGLLTSKFNSMLQTMISFKIDQVAKKSVGASRSIQKKMASCETLAASISRFGLVHNRSRDEQSIELERGGAVPRMMDIFILRELR